VRELLLITIFFPLFGVLLAVLTGKWRPAAVRQSALITSIITLVLATIVVVNYCRVTANEGGAPEFAVTELAWLGDQAPIDIQFSVGLDGLSVWLFGLAALLTFTAVLISWESIADRPVGFYSMLLLLETGMLGVFCARDIILFYIFFEFTLIPLFFLIGIWGSEERRYAAVKFFLFTFAGSVLTFLGLLTIVIWQYLSSPTHELTFSISRLTAALIANPIPNDAAHGYLQLLVFLALFAGFAIKVPLFPLHTWLPLAHTQAPAAGSVLLAGVLLKIGCYGFLRFNLPMLPEASAWCIPFLLLLAVIGIVYGALLALAQTDMKRLVACSSVSHMGFVMLGIFALNPLGLQGGVLQMINHGVSTGALFALVGMLYDRYHTRRIDELHGLARRLPWLAFFLVFFTFSSIGLPGTNGFAGEFMILLGMFQRGWSQAPAGVGWHWLALAVVAVSGVVLGAWYMLNLLRRILFGPLREPGDYPPIVDADPHGADAHGASAHGAVTHGSHGASRETPIQAAHGHAAPGHAAAGAHAAPHDLNFREVLSLAPLAVFVLWIGLAPGEFLRPIAPAVRQLAGPIDTIMQRDFAAAHPTPAFKPTAAIASATSAGPAADVAGSSQRSTSDRQLSPSRSAAGPLAASLAP
jgi:NADH-quinone oxidoreductase subunit M